jgi:hypothetical protein
VSRKDWQDLAKLAAAGGAIVALHGITSKKWTEAHTLFAVLGIIAFLGGGGTAGLTAA